MRSSSPQAPQEACPISHLHHHGFRGLLSCSFLPEPLESPSLAAFCGGNYYLTTLPFNSLEWSPARNTHLMLLSLSLSLTLFSHENCFLHVTHLCSAAQQWLRRRGPISLPNAALQVLFRQRQVRLWTPGSSSLKRVSRTDDLPTGARLLIPPRLSEALSNAHTPATGGLPFTVSCGCCLYALAAQRILSCLTPFEPSKPQGNMRLDAAGFILAAASIVRASARTLIEIGGKRLSMAMCT